MFSPHNHKSTASQGSGKDTGNMNLPTRWQATPRIKNTNSQGINLKDISPFILYLLLTLDIHQLNTFLSNQEDINNTDQ